MAEFKIQIADEDVERVINSIVQNYKRPTLVPNPDFDNNQPPSENNLEMIENPETPYQFANRKVREFLSQNVQAYEVKEAKRIAAEEARQNANPEITDPQLP